MVSEMTDEPGDPPPEAYGRVTNAERFAVLHEWVAELLDRLVEDYDVVRTDDVRTDADGEPTSTATLTPSRPDAAALRVTFTGFPGVAVACGRWSGESYPHCGCDACDEQPDELLDELITRIEAVVMGGFSEELTFGGERWLRTSVRTLRERGTSAELIEPEKYGTYGTPGRYDWQPWPRRS
jgi:Family of unknown function (DUF6226)